MHAVGTEFPVNLQLEMTVRPIEDYFASQMKQVHPKAMRSHAARYPRTDEIISSLKTDITKAMPIKTGTTELNYVLMPSSAQTIHDTLKS
jgi:predicted choloylglycine hydrolase